MTETHDLTTTTTPMHLTVDPYWDLIEVLAYGTVCDLIGSERYHALVEDRIAYVLDETLSEVVGFVVKGYAELDPLELDLPELWDGPRFGVPVLGLRGATLGEVMLAIRGRFAPGEPTADAMHFHLAIAAETAEEALPQWQLALEAGDMKAHYALGYTLCELGRYRNAYDHLRHYTELVANNAWAWCWLGKACAGCELFGEARAAYQRAIELDDDEETDAAELLAELDEAIEDLGAPATPVAEAAPSDPQFLRLSDGRSFLLGTRQEVDTALAQIIACTGGSSGGGRWSRLFGLQPELFIEAADLENFKEEATDLLITAGLALEDEAQRLLQRLGSL